MRSETRQKLTEYAVRTDDEAGGAWVPVGREETTKSGDEVNASGVLDLACESVHLGSGLDHEHGVTKPLDGATSDTDCTNA